MEKLSYTQTRNEDIYQDMIKMTDVYKELERNFNKIKENY
jgi:hypothetical protein